MSNSNLHVHVFSNPKDVWNKQFTLCLIVYLFVSCSLCAWIDCVLFSFTENGTDQKNPQKVLTENTVGPPVITETENMDKISVTC